MKKRFVVDLGSVDMDERTIQGVEASIQKAALNAVAELDMRGDLIARFPREWLGIWIDIQREGLPQADQFEKEFIAFAGR
jgi:hypothetical protein